MKVEHLKSVRSFEEQFYEVIKSGKHVGDIYGFPQTIHAWCNDRLKMKPLEAIKNSSAIRYLGIAADETERIERQKEKNNVILPLVKIGWTESACLDWCEENDFLAPNYKRAFRDGCWFCPKQPVEQLRLLRKNHRDLWELMLKWDNESPVPFKPDGHTVHDFDKRFQLEDEMCIDPNAPFRWKMLDEDLQIRMF